ncbi:hypothetical protein A3709_19200 [Halioglobus sp. HI00S01]|uniref:ArdC family protein n=1 Tax=Halioglobus sp. HI00S01 TaxID=1822214 RepID=UPI0007C394E7|nr:zincin-like metallopeptidase domain-containing protein [Halioglobus sp. HI00S01]KZX57751.1 hypothetical protein A3709_19200 [Halioglobus sp. HI00S01]
MASTRNEIYTSVTERILENLDGAEAWSKPWKSLSGQLPHNALTGRSYSGINLLILTLLGGAYDSPQWLTYNQARGLGGNVRKGESGTRVVLWKSHSRQVSDQDDEVIAYPVLKCFTVFNVSQCDGIDGAKLAAWEPPKRPERGVIELAERLNAKVIYTGNEAVFIPSLDQIRMPSMDAFNTVADHEATLLHELVHWTGAGSRLDRIAHHSLAEEELVAEIGAAMAGAILGIQYEGLQHEEYIAEWLPALANNHQLIFKAARLAQKAVDMIIPESAAAHPRPGPESMGHDGGTLTLNDGRAAA